MNKILITTLALTFCLMQSAFAKDLGVLSGDKIPQNLIQASEILNYLSTNHTSDVQTEQNSHLQNRNSSEFWGYGNYWGYGSYYPYYYGSYYYPYSYYGYGSYYPYYGSGWYYDRENDGQSRAQAETSAAVAPHMDAAHVPMVCFASNAAGNWFAEADIASNVAGTQEKVNHECAAAGGSCSLNLGCAIAVDHEQ